MNQSPLDPELQKLFRAAAPELHGQAFVARIARRMETERRRARLRRSAMQLAAIVLLLAASPWLIAGAHWISEVIAPQLTRATAWVGTLAGMASIAIVTLSVVIVRRLRAG